MNEHFSNRIMLGAVLDLTGKVSLFLKFSLLILLIRKKVSKVFLWFSTLLVPNKETNDGILCTVTEVRYPLSPSCQQFCREPNCEPEGDA